MLNLKQKLNLRKKWYLVCLQRLFVDEILVNLTNIWVCTIRCVQKRLQYIYGWIGQSQPSRFWRGSNLTSSQTSERPKFVSISEKFATRGSQRKYPRFSSNICSWNFSKTKTHRRKMNGSKVSLFDPVSLHSKQTKQWRLAVIRLQGHHCREGEVQLADRFACSDNERCLSSLLLAVFWGWLGKIKQCADIS